MKRIPKVIYLTADELESVIKDRETAALSLAPNSEEHRAIMKEIAQLRVYCDAKRWLSPQAKSA